MSIARAAAIFLLFGNLIFFAWAREYSGSPGDSREPQRLAAQLSPEKIRIVGTGKGGADAILAIVTPTGDSAIQAAAAPASATGDEKAAASAPEICRGVTELPLDEAEKLKATIYASTAAVAVTLRPLIEVQSYWLRVPPLRNREEAEKKAAEIKKLGVSDYYVVQDQGPNLNAISLGLFRSEQAATELRNRLSKKGVRTMDIQVREKTEKATLELRGPAALLEKPIAELLTKAGTRATECTAN
jgi:hypothetical protein